MAAAVAGAVCLGCAMATGAHRCAGAAELLPFGGWCSCPQPACGPTPTVQPPAAGQRRVARARYGAGHE